MTYKTMNQINFYATVGMGYQRIAEALDLSPNTVKSYLQRHPPKMDLVLCHHCGQIVPQARGRKPKQYCNVKCRMAYWNNHKDEVKRQAFYTMVCQHCGKEFVSYGNRNRKYCSRTCYANARRNAA